jgi:hypothetical protein
MASGSNLNLSNSTFNDLGGAASDLFAGFGAGAKGALQASGLRLTAQGTRISAEGTRISAESLRTKAQGDLAEASNYDAASTLAMQNEAFTAQSTRVQQSQLDRQVTQTIGGQAAGVAGAGFSSGGTALNLLRDSASQGALARGVLGQQGAITEAGFDEQAKSFTTMANAGRTTAASEMQIAGQTDVIAGEQNQIAAGQDQLAVQTQNVANQQATGDFIGAALKGAAAVASLALAPATGGLSLAVGAAAAAAPTGTGGLY